MIKPKRIWVDAGAVFSDCKKYRYVLWRTWDESKPSIMFIGLNPSTANAKEEDATVRKVIGFAERYGYGKVYMMNCFPFVSTDPKLLKDTANIGLNDEWLHQISLRCNEIVFAWGNFKIVRDMRRDQAVSQLFPKAKALVINKNGSPKHPLYVPYSAKLVEFPTIYL